MILTLILLVCVAGTLAKDPLHGMESNQILKKGGSLKLADRIYSYVKNWVKRLWNKLHVKKLYNIVIATGSAGKALIATVMELLALIPTRKFTDVRAIADVANTAFNAAGKVRIAIEEVESFIPGKLNFAKQLISKVGEQLGYMRCMRVTYCTRRRRSTK